MSLRDKGSFVSIAGKVPMPLFSGNLVGHHAHSPLPTPTLLPSTLPAVFAGSLLRRGHFLRDGTDRPAQTSATQTGAADELEGLWGTTLENNRKDGLTFEAALCGVVLVALCSS